MENSQIFAESRLMTYFGMFDFEDSLPNVFVFPSSAILCFEKWAALGVCLDKLAEINSAGGSE